MDVMLGNRPSPRPGFTHVADALERRQGPIVVLVSDSPASVNALRRAAGEAAMKSVHLHVLESCSSEDLKDRLLREPELVGARERSAALSILRNPNVMTARMPEGGLDEVVSYCKQVGASLLVMDTGCLEDVSGPSGVLGSIVDEIDLTCDLLLVREALVPSP